MPNNTHSSFSMSVLVDWLSSRFIAFGLPAGQDKKKDSAMGSRPALLYSRSTTLGLLLSIALSFVERSRFYHPLFVQDKNGLLFNNKVVPF